MSRGRQSQPTHLIADRVWYYVHNGSIDLVVSEPNVSPQSVRLKRAWLLRMLSQLRPLKTRARKAR